MVAALIILFIIALAATIAAFVFLLPEKRKSRLSPFWNRIRDFLRMKELYLEKIYRALYVISSIFVFVFAVIGGFVLPLVMPASEGGGFGAAILGLLGGIIAAALLLFILRISYESIMLKVSLTKATKDINEKMGGASEPRGYEEPRRRPAPRPVVCRRCGTRFDPRRGYCPNCDERW